MKADFGPDHCAYKVKGRIERGNSARKITKSDDCERDKTSPSDQHASLHNLDHRRG